MKKFISDFKAFALKGNIVDMAIGVVIGGAFGKIVTSLVNDIITPLISLLTGSVSFKDLKWVFKEAIIAADGTVTTPEAALTYGNFIQTVIDFFIIAISIFVVMKVAMGAREKLENMKKKEEEAAVETAQEEPKDTELSVLLEIKELLKKDE